MPYVPCTEIAPTTSSTFTTRSKNSTESDQNAGDQADDAAPIGLTNPLGAVMATRPASSPLPVIDASGLPYRIHM